MSIPKAALAALLAIQGANLGAQSRTAQPAAGFSGAELARAIKTSLESIGGAGTVNVSIDHRSNDGATIFNVKIAMPGFDSRLCAQIYDRERDLRQLFPDLEIDFHFDGSDLARAIKADLESISGPGTVEVSIDSQTLFNVRIAIPGFNSQLYSQLYDRELEFYRAFRDLNFDFYLRPTAINPAPPDAH